MAKAKKKAVTKKKAVVKKKVVKKASKKKVDTCYTEECSDCPDLSLGLLDPNLLDADSQSRYEILDLVLSLTDLSELETLRSKISIEIDAREEVIKARQAIEDEKTRLAIEEVLGTEDTELAPTPTPSGGKQLREDGPTPKTALQTLKSFFGLGE